MQVREAIELDLPVLVAIYSGSVRVIGPEKYSAAQVETWAGFAGDRERFHTKVLNSTCLVAEEDGEVVGFVTLESPGVVGLLYVRADRTRQGIGSALVRAVVDLARRLRLCEVRTLASEFSRGLFERAGFAVLGVEESHYNGEVFVRYRMARGV
ncbi:MAG: GNAT family N-acetyltransferase [bacterium]|nr:GNAT family N-acetyltransferase [bacterium]